MRKWTTTSKQQHLKNGYSIWSPPFKMISQRPTENKNLFSGTGVNLKLHRTCLTDHLSQRPWKEKLPSGFRKTNHVTREAPVTSLRFQVTDASKLSNQTSMVGAVKERCAKFSLIFSGGGGGGQKKSGEEAVLLSHFKVIFHRRSVQKLRVSLEQSITPLFFIFLNCFRIEIRRSENRLIANNYLPDEFYTIKQVKICWSKKFSFLLEKNSRILSDNFKFSELHSWPHVKK